jgi:hypothetical protein
MDVLLRVTAEDGQLLASAAVIRLRAATVEGHRTEAADRTEAVEVTVDMGGRIALDFFPAQ